MGLFRGDTRSSDYSSHGFPLAKDFSTRLGNTQVMTRSSPTSPLSIIVTIIENPVVSCCT